MKNRIVITALVTALLFYLLCYYYYLGSPQVPPGFLQTFFSEIVFLMEFWFITLPVSVVLVAASFKKQFRPYSLGALLGIGIPLGLYLALQVVVMFAYWFSA